MDSHQRRVFRRAVARGIAKQVQTKSQLVQQPVQPSEPKPKPTFLSRFWHVLSIVAVVFGLVTGALVFKSSVTIDPQLLRDPSNPFTTSFTVTNDGVFDIEPTFACRMNHVELRGTYNILFRGGLDAAITPLREPKIGAHKSQDITCQFGVNGQPIVFPINFPPAVFGDLDITIVVTYRSRFWPKTTEFQRFRAQCDGHGKIVGWSHESEPYPGEDRAAVAGKDPKDEGFLILGSR